MSFKILTVNCKKWDHKEDTFLSGSAIVDDEKSADASFLLCSLYRQVTSLLESKASDRNVVRENDAEDTKYSPSFWIMKWAKSSQKHGFCYELCDRSVGILFNDRTQLIIDPSGQYALFIDQNNQRRHFLLDHWPADLEKKQKLLGAFWKRRTEAHRGEPLVKTGMDLESVPRLRLWRMTSSMLVMQLTDGTVQINFLLDHNKLVCSPLLNSVSLVDCDRQIRTYRLQLLERHGCSKTLLHKVYNAKRMIELLVLENEDCVRALSRDGYEFHRPVSAPSISPLSDVNGMKNSGKMELSLLPYP